MKKRGNFGREGANALVAVYENNSVTEENSTFITFHSYLSG